MRPPRALVFDFNGTLSHDEPVLYAIYRDLFAEHARPLAEHEYFERLLPPLAGVRIDRPVSINDVANTVLADIHDITFRLKPVINDARIFMDKVATEPGRIITGGLNPSSVK